MAEQQICWTRCGTHLLVLIRTQMLDNTLTATFQRWFPGMGETSLATEEHMAA